MTHQRPPPDLFQFVRGWRCPLCAGGIYLRISVKRAGRKDYLTEFYECADCTVMFRHPGKFTRLGRPLHRHMDDVGPRSLSEVHRLVTQPQKDSSK